MPFNPWDFRNFQSVVPMSIPGAPTPVPSFTMPTSPPPPAPPSRPPSLTMFQGLPLGPQTRETVIQPPPSVPDGNRPPIPLLGPGAANPSITGAPTTPVMPGTEFGNPARREATRLTADTSEKSWQDKLMEKVKNGDFTEAVSILGKSMGGGGGGVQGSAPPRADLIPAQSPHKPNTSGEMKQIIAGLPSRTAREAFEQKRARRRKTQDRYDLENWRQ